LEFRVSKVAQNKDTPIVVYCGAGFRSPLAAKTLQDMGYTNVKNYSAGFVGWRKDGLPIK
jgi:rhodanese-related sulfurtransferase